MKKGMTKKKGKKRNTISLPIEWHVPKEIEWIYATNMVVQHSEDEFTISFFQIDKPIFLGKESEIINQWGKIKTAKAKCVARIIVAPSRMKNFIEVLQANFDKFLSDQGIELK